MTCPPFAHLTLRGRILLLEQPSVFREMETLLLRGAGYDVLACDEPAFAVTLLARQNFDAMVVNTDHEPAHLTELATELRALNRKLVLVFGANDETLTDELTRRGVTAVLPRPVDPHALVLRIDELLGFCATPGGPRLQAAAEPNHTVCTATTRRTGAV